MVDSVKTVGREPTPEMMNAAPASHSASFREIWPKICGDIWCAMWDKAAASPAGAEVVRVKPLVWEEITHARSDEDPTREPSGDYEAVTPVGTYYIEMYFGTDSYGWDVSFNGDHVADRDDPDDAKAVALTHFNQIILSALEPTPSTDAVRRQAREEAARELDAISAAYRKSAGVVFELDMPDAAAKSAAIDGIADVVAECAAVVRALSTPPAGAAALNEGEE